MSIITELYEDSGPIVSGHGTNRVVVSNIGWKNDPSNENTPYPAYPISIPSTSLGTNYSYTKYNYFKWSGTYIKASRPRVDIRFSSIVQDIYSRTNATIKLLIATSSTYGGPSNSPLSYEYAISSLGGSVLVPLNTSNVGPESATTHPQWLSTNTTYYSEYLITQISVFGGTLYGNLPNLTLNFEVDEYETENL